MQSTTLWQPLRLGALTLPNRVIMAPLGRARADAQTREPGSSVATYYRQRASAGLIISEATHVSPNSVSRPGTAAIHTQGQVAAWGRVTQAVHEAGGRIFQQLFHLGRKADPARLPAGGLPVAPSPIAALGTFSTPLGPRPFPVPRALLRHEIAGIVAEFVGAAENAKSAGFDGVEIHGANGFLIDQFLRNGANQRVDDHGGSVENRARLLLDVVDGVSRVIGADRVGVRVSPHAVQDGTADTDPARLYEHVAERLRSRGIAYLHLIEPTDTAHADRLAPRLRAAFAGPLLVCGGFDGATAASALREGRADAIAFGAGFIANPDLVDRLRLDAPWNVPDVGTFYSGGDEGYIDYPFLRIGTQGARGLRAANEQERNAT